jgi:hypothetical protein
LGTVFNEGVQAVVKEVTDHLRTHILDMIDYESQRLESEAMRIKPEHDRRLAEIIFGAMHIHDDENDKTDTLYATNSALFATQVQLINEKTIKLLQEKIEAIEEAILRNKNKAATPNKSRAQTPQSRRSRSRSPQGPPLQPQQPQSTPPKNDARRYSNPPPPSNGDYAGRPHWSTSNSFGHTNQQQPWERDQQRTDTNKYNRRHSSSSHYADNNSKYSNPNSNNRNYTSANKFNWKDKDANR